jgi:voltage-gated potassium channel
VENLYKTVNNVHSHLISGPDKNAFNSVLNELEEIEEVIGVNLTNEEIAKITAKEIT